MSPRTLLGQNRELEGSPYWWHETAQHMLARSQSDVEPSHGYIITLPLLEDPAQVHPHAFQRLTL